MFSSRPVFRDVGCAENGRAVYILVEDLEYHLGLDGDDGLQVTVPAGTDTDLASVPRLFWPIFPPGGPWSAAAVVHDYLYRVPTCSRFLADSIFREAMASLGVPWWRRVAMYYAVRLFGDRARKVRIAGKTT